ncbi:MAG: thioredoxin domain-containing protein [Syntrophomonas sp.]
MPESKYVNRLINEKSPYLLAHAYDPVNWYSWGEEAFKEAASKQMPVFLSIGYSSCHWCHVMHRECFQNAEIAAVLNDGFVCVKVDREERPDIDSIYMSVCQALNGHGGWPLTIVMTPEKLPFFAATYLPPRSQRGMTGMDELLPRILDLWKNDRSSVDTSGERIRDWLKREADINRQGELEEKMLRQACRYLEKSFDPDYGGFSRAPKFPSPHQLLFLLRYHHHYKEEKALEMVEKTLEAMYRGGIYDHLGGGFARYSTDRQWLIPHFEKMLYDNALLAMAYLEAFQTSGRGLYRQVAIQIFEYILRDMRSPEGGFYSAEDADSEGVEGRFYVWRTEQVADVLGDEAAEFCATYGISQEGNYEGSSVPNLRKGLPEAEAEGKLSRMKEALLLKREQRPRPEKDDKILGSWNSLMIAALAMGARIMKAPAYLEAAREAVQFLLTRLRRPDGRLLARYREGDARYEAYVDDYAFLIWALIELYQADYDPQDLKTALELNKDMIKYFWDEESAGFFLYGSDAENLIHRPKEVYDGALPSGNSVAALNLLRLARLTGESGLEERAVQLMRHFAGQAAGAPSAHTFYMIALLYYLVPGSDVSIVGSRKQQDTVQMLDEISSAYHPFTHVILKEEGLAPSEYDILSGLRALPGNDGRAVAYLCCGHTCQPPIDSLAELQEQTRGL